MARLKDLAKDRERLQNPLIVCRTALARIAKLEPTEGAISDVAIQIANEALTGSKKILESLR